MPPAESGGVNRQPQLRAPLLDQPRAPQNAGAVHPDRIASAAKANMEGQLVSTQRVPQGNVRLLFVNVDPRTDQQTTTTDASGRFRASLAGGEWLVYTQDASGRPIFQQKVRIGGVEPFQMTLVSR
jgi:hypothetical protein